MASLINAVKRWNAFREGWDAVVDIELQLPTDATLAVFCCEGETSAKMKERGGNRVPHGNRLFFPCNPLIVQPELSVGVHKRFRYPVCNCRHDQPCTLAAFEYAATPGFLRWTSLTHPCPECPEAFGSATVTTDEVTARGFSSGYAGFRAATPAFDFGDHMTFMFSHPEFDLLYETVAQWNGGDFEGTGSLTIGMVGGGAAGSGGAGWTTLAEQTFPISTGATVEFVARKTGVIPAGGAAGTFSVGYLGSSGAFGGNWSTSVITSRVIPAE